MMTIESLIESVDHLPATPRVVPRLLGALQNPEASVDEMVEVLEVAPTLTAQIIKHSNSAFYGFSQPSHSIKQAITRIGMYEAFRLVNALVGKSMQQVSDKNSAYHDAYWTQSMALALAMEEGARKVYADVSLAYAIGMFYPIGSLVISHVQPEQYLQVESVIAQGEKRLNAENEVFGFNGPQVARELLDEWGFPNEIALAIGGLDVEGGKYVSILKLAQWLVVEMSLLPSSEKPSEQEQAKMREDMCIDEEWIQEALEVIKERLEDINNMLDEK